MMNLKPQWNARRTGPVQINGMRTGLLGRVASERGIQMLATHGVPHGSVTLRELALLIGVSVRRSSQAIKLTEGVSLFRWIAERRVAEARRLLIETDLPVDEIGRRFAPSPAARPAPFGG